MRHIVIVITVLLLSCISAYSRDFVHIFTSKGIYETCEDLWFKGLILNDSTFSLSDKYHTAYVEIVNRSDSVVWQEKYPVNNGECNGHIYVGDDWASGEYRMYIHTAGSLGADDRTMTPKKLLIVRELPEAQNFISKSGNITTKNIDSVSAPYICPLKITMQIDSPEYHPRSLVKLKIKVTDHAGSPQKAKIALSVYDCLYRYVPGDLDLLSHCMGIRNLGASRELTDSEIFLADGAVTGYMKSGKKKRHTQLGNQFINVFDFSNTAGILNIVSTESDGRFEIPKDMALSLGRDILLKPLSGKEMKPTLSFDNHFDVIDSLRRNCTDMYFRIYQQCYSNSTDRDTLDYTNRRTVRLDEIVVKAKAGRYPRRNKLLGQLDSISTIYGGAWVCGCPASKGISFLNDYLPGYTHHLPGCGYDPVKKSLPVKGKTYMLIKYSGVYRDDYVEDIRVIEYPGPKYSEEELLKMNGIWKTTGYYPYHNFESPNEDEISLGLEDNRNTLLWLPEATTDDLGELTIEFFTSDISSLFQISGYALDIHTNNIGVINGKFRVGMQ